MRVLLAILVLLTTLPCDGQVRRRVLGPRPGSGGPTLPGGIQYQWVATNLSSPVASWPPSAGVCYLSSPAGVSYQPTYTNGYGVNYNSSAPKYSEGTNNYPTTGGQFAALVICRMDVTNDATARAIWSWANGTCGVGATYNRWSEDAESFGCIEAGKVYDVLRINGGGGSVFAAGSVFTNGVLGDTGWPALGYNILPYRFGCGFAYTSGAVYEFIFWTNTVSWTQTEVDMIHRYSSNRIALEGVTTISP